MQSLAINQDNFTNGQPTRSANNKRNNGLDWFKLGHTTASLEQIKKENDQQSLMNMIQLAQLNKTKNDLLDILAEVKRNIPQALPQIGQGLPLINGNAPGGLPPLGGQQIAAGPDMSNAGPPPFAMP